MPAVHVRNERATRAHYGLLGSGADLPANMCVAFCGYNASSQFFLGGVDHLVNTLIASTTMTPCRWCLLAIAGVLHQEMEFQPTCEVCERALATCYGTYETPDAYLFACDGCCGHGSEDGVCRPIREAT